MRNIGEPLPKGVVDVAHDFVGVPKQEVNVRHEYVRLRKQVKLLRRRVENLGIMPAKLQKRYTVGVVAVGVLLVVSALRIRNTLR